jgi:hypothetical protein
MPLQALGKVPGAEGLLNRESLFSSGSRPRAAVGATAIPAPSQGPGAQRKPPLPRRQGGLVAPRAVTPRAASAPAFGRGKPGVDHGLFGPGLGHGQAEFVEGLVGHFGGAQGLVILGVDQIGDPGIPCLHEGLAPQRIRRRR